MFWASWRVPSAASAGPPASATSTARIDARRRLPRNPAIPAPRNARSPEIWRGRAARSSVSHGIASELGQFSPGGRLALAVVLEAGIERHAAIDEQGRAGDVVGQV